MLANRVATCLLAPAPLPGENSYIRRGGRAVECTGLENQQGLTPFEGSNPSLSAIIKSAPDAGRRNVQGPATHHAFAHSDHFCGIVRDALSAIIKSAPDAGRRIDRGPATNHAFAPSVQLRGFQRDSLSAIIKSAPDAGRRNVQGPATHHAFAHSDHFCGIVRDALFAVCPSRDSPSNTSIRVHHDPGVVVPSPDPRPKTCIKTPVPSSRFADGRGWQTFSPILYW